MFKNFPSHRFQQGNRLLPGLSLLILLLSLFLFTIPDARAAVQVTLAWDPNSEPDLTGYKVYYGTSTRNYGVSRDAGNVNSYTISDLQEGTTLYFAATAYDRYGNESDFSEEVVYVAQAINNPPVAENGALNTNQDTAAAGSLTATDPDSDTLTFSVVTQGTLGTVVITNSTTGAYTYSPSAGAKGSDTFTFQVADSGGLISTATVAVTIVAVNHAPVAQDGTLTTNQDTIASGTLKATDLDGDSLNFSVTSQGGKGLVAISNGTTGAYTYTPKAGATGSDTFTFQVRDPGALFSTATVAVTIVAVNRAPVAQNGTLSTPQETLGSGVLVATDPDGDLLNYTLATQPGKGAVVITNAAAGSYTYTPNAGAIGDDSFSFLVRDPGNLTSSGSIAITITQVNQPPVASNGTLSTVSGTPATGKLIASDPNGDTLSYSLVSSAKLGSISLTAATGSFTYTPNAGSSGTDTFNFKASDGKVDSNVATFTVTINAHVSVRLEAEQGELTTPMVRVNDTTASGGQYIWVANGKGNVTDPLKAGGQAVYSFDVPAAGNYRVWARVMANTTADNSFFVSMDYDPSITWNTALAGMNTWAWDVVKDRNGAEPSSFTLTAGTHTLIVKQMEDGTKIDAIVITSQPAWIPETVYGDAEDSTIDGWDVFDASPSGASITNVFDNDRNSRVFRVKGSKTNNGYRLRSNSYTDWANQSQFVIEWSMKYAETFIIYVEVETTRGYRYFQYEPLARDYLGRYSQVRLGLGTDVRNGQWHTFVRDLQVDLTKAQPGVTILAVKAFSIRGTGLIDDVKLRATR